MSKTKENLNLKFDNLYFYLNNYADIFKVLFKENDYDEFYYSAKALIEELNDIKIILNLLRKHDNYK